MWEVPGSRWAAIIRDDGSGIALLTEAKYGFSCRDGDLQVTLLRSPVSPDREADQGEHHIRFAIGEHQERHGELRLNTAAAADALFAPVVVARRAAVPHPPFELRELGSLTPSWVLPAERGGGFVIRLHETAGGSGSTTLRLPVPPGAVRFVDFLEREVGRPGTDADGDFIVPYGPYQVVSVLVERAQ